MAVDLAQKAQNLMNRGRQALESKNYELAVDLLMEAVRAVFSRGRRSWGS